MLQGEPRHLRQLQRVSEAEVRYGMLQWPAAASRKMPWLLLFMLIRLVLCVPMEAQGFNYYAFDWVDRDDAGFMPLWLGPKDSRRRSCQSECMNRLVLTIRWHS